MKRLKSSLRDLSRLFHGAIAVREIAEPLTSFDSDHDERVVLKFMKDKDFDVVGVRKHGLVVGYWRCRESHDVERGSGLLEFVQFHTEELLDDIQPLSEVFKLLHTRQQVFVKSLGQVSGIVTKGDLQKIPVRLWLFGLISLIEMQMLRVIRERFTDDSSINYLEPSHQNTIRNKFKRQRSKKIELSLADCLSIGDKATILFGDDVLRRATKLDSGEDWGSFLRDLKSLRNALAHASDIVKGSWPALAQVAEKCESLLSKLEQTHVGLAGLSSD